jgi:hypothetical protein
LACGNAPLADVADASNSRMEIDERYPANDVSFLDRCGKAGQQRPTPLLLQYVPVDFNCLRQDPTKANETIDLRFSIREEYSECRSLESN